MELRGAELPDRRQDPEIQNKWQEKIKYYYADKEQHTKELLK